jgi:hypothetical protein
LETGNYKYFAGVCRGFLGFEKEKKFEGDGEEKMLRFSTQEEKQVPRAMRPRFGMTTLERESKSSFARLDSRGRLSLHVFT